MDVKGQNFTFRSNAAYRDFVRVEVDGKTIDGKNYTVKEGSIIVTWKDEYVATLSAGEHILGIVSENGTATTNFTVRAKTAKNNASPTTGDNGYMNMWFSLLLLSGGLFATISIYGKKKRK